MDHGKAFLFGRQSSKTSAGKHTIPVYKNWLKAQGRTFLVEEVPLLNTVSELKTLPLTSRSSSLPNSTLCKASTGYMLPPAHPVLSDGKRILLASRDTKPPSGFVLDYNEIDDDQTDYTFATGTTYYVSSSINLFGTTTFENGAVIKLDENNGNMEFYSIDCQVTGVDQPVIVTSMNDDSVGDIISGSSGSPEPCMCDAFDIYTNYVSLNCFRFNYQSVAFFNWSDPSTNIIWNSEFNNCGDIIDLTYGKVVLRNVLNPSVNFFGAAIDWESSPGEWYWLDAQDVTSVVGGSPYGFNEPFASWPDVPPDLTLVLTNCILMGSPDDFSSATSTQDVSTNATFQTFGNADYYLTATSPCHNAGTTSIESDLLTEIEGMTTYSPPDGGMPDTSGTDIGYHYPTNEDSMYDGVPDWWEYKYFGATGYSATDLDGDGNTLLYDYENNYDPNIINFSINVTNNYSSSSSVPAQLSVSGVPYYISVVLDDTNYVSDAVWEDFTSTNITINLGSTQGWHSVWIGLRGHDDSTSAAVWKWKRLKLDSVPPTIVVTNPAVSTVSVPVVQVQGYSLEELSSISFDLSNALEVVTNQAAGISDQCYSTNTWEFTTNYFECVNVPLTNGLNVVTIHATDMAGNKTSINFSFTLNYSGAANPIIKLAWPQNGMQICQTSFTLRGWTDDSSSAVTAQIVDDDNDTNIITGVVDRTGEIWVQNLPLAEGTNELTLWVTNAAGFSSKTNVSLVKNDMTLALTGTSGDLWLPTVDVNGTISDTTATVYVNGVEGVNNGDGTWSANNVPTSPGSVACFDIKAIPLGGGDPDANTDINKADEIIATAYTFHYDYDETSYIDGSHYSGNWDMPSWKPGESVDMEVDNYWDWPDGESGYSKSHYISDIDQVMATVVTTYDDDGTVTMTTNLVDFEPLSGGDHCEVTCGAPDDGNAGLQHQHAQTTLQLMTGGKPGSSLQNLFQITGGVTAYNPDLINPFLLPALPLTDITMGELGPLTLSGYLYVILPDNAQRDATPEEKARDYYTFSAGRTKYLSYLDVFVTQPDPTGTRVWEPGINAGHAWWRVRTDAPWDAVLQFNTGSANLEFLGGQVGYGPNGTIDWILPWNSGSAPGEFPFPHGTPTVTRTYGINFTSIYDGLTYEEGINANPGTYNIPDNDCVTKTIGAGSSVGVTLPLDQTPEQFGKDLPPDN